MRPEKVSINDAPKTEDIFIGNDLFSDVEIENDDKQYIDNILQQADMYIAQLIKKQKKLSLNLVHHRPFTIFCYQDLKNYCLKQTKQ